MLNVHRLYVLNSEHYIIAIIHMRQSTWNVCTASFSTPSFWGNESTFVMRLVSRPVEGGRGAQNQLFIGEVVSFSCHRCF